jgi:hypothetical protein
MKAKWFLGLLALGFVAMFVSVAAAQQLPAPVVYLKMDGNLNNSGAGGSAYNGSVETAVVVPGNDPIYGAGKSSDALNLNPALVVTTSAQPVDQGNNVAVNYTLPNSGTISMWYKFSTPAYDYQSLINNSAGADAWEMYSTRLSKVGGRIIDLPQTPDPGTGAQEWWYIGNSTVWLYGVATEPTWHHVAFEWNRHTDNPALVDTTFYLDGAVPTYTKSGVTYYGNRLNRPWTDPGSTIYLGGNHGNTNATGYFEEVRIYDQVLAADQIAALMRIPLAGDANMDWTVNVSDLTALLNNYNKTGQVWENGDFDYNGIVNVADLTALLNNYNKTAPAGLVGAGSTVPEPGTMAMLLAALIGSLAYAWRKRR